MSLHPYIPVSQLSPEALEKRRAYYREYQKKHKAKLKRARHNAYMLSCKRDKTDRQLRYKYDPEWREKVKEYNRKRMQLIREGKWHPTKGKNYEQNKSAQISRESS